MKPTILQYEAPGWGIGEAWLDEKGRVSYSELPGPRRTRVGAGSRHVLTGRLQAFFAGEADDCLDVPLVLGGGFHGACAKALRKIERGQVVTYGELAALAGRPR